MHVTARIVRATGQICTTTNLKSDSENIPLNIPKITFYKTYGNHILEFHESLLEKSSQIHRKIKLLLSVK